MSVTVTLNIPEEIVRQAQAIAASSQRRVEDVLADWLDRAAAEIQIDQLPDEEVLRFAQQQMPDEQQTELSDLLAEQREGQLTAAGRTRLDELMLLYRRGLVRKAQAVKVAVERGLMPPLG